MFVGLSCSEPVDTPMDPNSNCIWIRGVIWGDSHLIVKLNYLTITWSDISSAISVVS